jgi:hypothetical protein
MRIHYPALLLFAALVAAFLFILILLGQMLIPQIVNLYLITRHYPEVLAVAFVGACLFWTFKALTDD